MLIDGALFLVVWITLGGWLLDLRMRTAFVFAAAIALVFFVDQAWPQLLPSSQTIVVPSLWGGGSTTSIAQLVLVAVIFFAIQGVLRWWDNRHYTDSTP